MTKVGEYSRISDDDERDPLHGKGVARQQHDTGSLLALRGWESGGRYVDDDLSAFKITVTRPDFERLMNDLETGRLDGIAGYDVDRLFRQPSDLERAIRIYDSRPGLLFATVQGNIDLSTPDGRTMARVLVAFANKASMDTSRRVSRQKLERAMNGDSTSNFRAFGWNLDGTLNEPEAALLRSAMQSIFDGIGLPTITVHWCQQEIKTVRGKDWHSNNLRRVLSAPRMAGLAVYRDELILGDDGQPVRGNWTALLTEAEWRALHDIINPGKGIPRARRRSYLLSGIARCSLCGMGMVGGTRPNGKFRYMCRSVDAGGCAKVSIDGTKLDEQIRDLVLAYTGGRVIEEPVLPAFAGEARLVEIGEKIAELMAAYNSNALSGGIVFPQVKKLEDERAQLQAQRTAYTKTQKRATTIPGEWPDWDTEQRRVFILSVLEAVVVRPVGRGGGGYQPDRVDPVWRELPAQLESNEPALTAGQVQAVA